MILFTQALPTCSVLADNYWAPECTKTSGSAMAKGPRDALVSRNSATTKHPI